ncbi:MAG: ParB/RepB/Spo0J family partition protein, partial [Spirochaetia bacterium]|nr:ParB/RepB/Spo0J family partition protein [Spirochaetia bacterium]
LYGVDELADSIKKDGLLSPIVVTKDGEGYRIIAGERRYHAVKKLGWTDVECRIISREERDYFRIAIIENLQRENLSAEEEAAALLRLKIQESYSDAELAEIVGKSRNYVTEILGIASLPEETLARCKTLGIDNKNMLIQVVQAHKKGVLDELMAAFTQGSVKTVRSARDIVQGRTGQGTGSDKGGSKSKAKNDYKVHVSGKHITIACPTTVDAQTLAARIEVLTARLSK